jgi:hypothetical protein
LSQPQVRVFAERDRADAEGVQSCSGLGESADAGGQDQHLGESDLARSEVVLPDSRAQQLGCAGVVGVVGIKVRDEHARIQNDQAGQSSRRSFRNPDGYMPVSAPAVLSTAASL